MDQILAAIDKVTDLNTLNQINAHVGARWRRLQAVKATEFRLGDDVAFVGKFGQRLTGKVIGQKGRKHRRIMVMVDRTRWTVSPNLLTRL